MQITLLVIAGLSIIALLVMYLLLRRSMREEVARLHAELNLVRAGHEHALEVGLRHLRDRIQNRSHDNGVHDLTPEALSEVAAMLSAFLGKDVHISAAADVPVANEANHLWAQQGYVAVQNSHDLASVKLVAAPLLSGSIRRPPSSVRRNVA